MNGTYPENAEKLYLLEFLVDSVCLFEAKVTAGQEESAKGGTTCVQFQFLCYPPLEVCEDDFCPSGAQKNAEIMFKSGKSCLFSVGPPQQIPIPFDVNVTVLRTIGCSSEKRVLGKTVVNLGGSFAALSNAKSTGSCPVSKAVKDVFCLVNENGSVGTISLFIRLSTFGKAIVTQFQVGEASSSFMFRGETKQGPQKSGMRADCHPGMGGGEENRNPCAPPTRGPCATVPSRPISNMPFKPSFGPGFQPGIPPARSFPPAPCPGMPFGPYPGHGFPVQGFSPAMYQNPPFTAFPAPSSMPYGGGPGPKPQNKPLPTYCESSSSPSSSSEEDCKPLLNLCDCDYPEPPGLRPPKRKKKKKKKAKQFLCPLEQAAKNGFCANADCPMGLPPPPNYNKEVTLPPGSIGVAGNQVIFQNQRDPNSHATYKISSNEPGDNIIRVEPDPNQSGGPVDENKDVFVLKIGKKNSSCPPADKLRLELKTPKIEIEPKVEMQDNECQYLESDISNVSKGGEKKGKNKNGKGGKGGKNKGGKKKK